MTEFQTWCTEHEGRHDRIEDATDKRLVALESAVVDLRDKFSNRLPTWATLLMTFMGTMSGALIGVLAAHAIQ